MASFTYQQLEQIWMDAGGSVLSAPIAAAIALAESGGCQYALAAPQDIRPVKQCTYRYTTGEFSIGLWQINTDPALHRSYDRQRLFDPAYNAAAAIAISGSGNNFRPWTTFVNGSYRRYLGGAARPPADKTPPTKPPPKGATPKTQLPQRPSPPGSHAARPGNVVHNWKMLAHAIGSTLPTQDFRTRQISHAYKRAIR